MIEYVPPSVGLCSFVWALGPLSMSVWLCHVRVLGESCDSCVVSVALTDTLSHSLAIYRSGGPVRLAFVNLF